MSANQLPLYVDYGGVTTAPAPFDLADALVYAFFLKADPAKLAAMCDKVFNTPSGGQACYIPVSPYVMLTFGTVNVTSMVPPWNTIGYVVEVHAALWIMTAGVKEEGGYQVAQEIRLFIPAIFVDNPISLAGGREIHGFAKNWGWATLPDPVTMATLTLDAFGGNFGTNTTAHRVPLLELQRTDLSEPLRLQPLADLGDAAEVVGNAVAANGGDQLILPSLDLIVALMEDMWNHDMPIVYLRQFRSAEDGTRASQQQIVEASIQMNTFELHLIDNEYSFTLYPIDSHPFGEELGIGNQQIPFGIRITGHLTQDDGVVVWQAATT